MTNSTNVAVFDYVGQVRSHYVNVWNVAPSQSLRLRGGPIDELPAGYSVLEFPPAVRGAWTYATCGMSQPRDKKRLELHLLSPEQDAAHVELLTAVAHYHRTGTHLGLGHTVNFGRAWIASSECTHGLIALPYLDGPQLEVLELPIGRVEFLWLVPITPQEVAFLGRHGLEALEEKFDAGKLNYLDPRRESVV